MSDCERGSSPKLSPSAHILAMHQVSHGATSLMLVLYHQNYHAFPAHIFVDATYRVSHTPVGYYMPEIRDKSYPGGNFMPQNPFGLYPRGVFHA